MTSWECLYGFLGALGARELDRSPGGPGALPSLSSPAVSSDHCSRSTSGLLPGRKDPASFPLKGQLPLLERAGGGAGARLRPRPHPRGPLGSWPCLCVCASPGLEAAMMVGVHGGAELGARGGGGGRGDGAGWALMSLFVSPPSLPPLRCAGPADPAGRPG